MANDHSNRRPKNHWLIQLRKWHAWLGVGLSVLFLMIALTGIYLNHKDFFNRIAKGDWSLPTLSTTAYADGEKDDAKKAQADQSLKLHTGTDLGKLPVSFQQALAAARQHLGEVELEKIELKNEKGSLVYKIKTMDERELIIDLTTGKGMLKEKKIKETKPDDNPGETKDNHKNKPGPHENEKGEKQGTAPADDATAIALKISNPSDHSNGSNHIAQAEQGITIVIQKVGQGTYRMANGSLDWPKVLKDAHTGKLFGAVGGKLLVDFAALVIIGLTLSGLYLWWVPQWRKITTRRQARGKPAFGEWTRRPVMNPAAAGACAKDRP